MTSATRERLFGFQHAFDHPVTIWATIGIVAALIVSALIVRLLRRFNRINQEQYDDVWTKWKSWVWLALFMITPILLGAAWTMAAVALLSLACYREYARATGLFREKTISAVVVLGIVVVSFAVIDHYDRLFFAAASLTVSLIAIATIPFDRPSGYIQRTALGVFGFLLFGFSLGYMGNIANDPNYRPVLIMILLGVEMNDIFAYCVGKSLTSRKLIPNTSPGKTVAGAIGALVLTTVVVTGIGHVIFLGTAIDRLHLLIGLGVMISVLGQLGDLVLSSIKRDVGIKDIGTLIPGHGGVLDRFDSLVLVPPAVFHYLSYHLGPLGSQEAARIISGG